MNTHEKCPWCGAIIGITIKPEIAVNKRHYLDCEKCGKKVSFTAIPFYSLKLEQVPCAHGGDRGHKWMWYCDKEKHFVTKCEVCGKLQGHEAEII